METDDTAVITFADFESALQSALLHLKDPTYHPEEALRRVLGVVTLAELQPILAAAIVGLEPLPASAKNSRLHRVHQMLFHRFLQEEPQKETARRLGITPRHLRREQQMAIHVLAERLWPHGLVAQPWRDTATAPHDEPESSPDWRSQLEQETFALQQQMPHAATDVRQAVAELLALITRLDLRRQVCVRSAPQEAGLATTLHPAVLGQLLLTAVEKLAAADPGAAIEIVVDSWLRWTRVVVAAAIDATPDSEFIAATLAAHGGLATSRRRDGRAEFELLLPTGAGLMVLVVDDNLDLVHFYRRFVEGTRYHLAHVSGGQQVWPVIERMPPDLIVLDVMLPDMSGWQLLHDLRRHARAAAIPVVVCTVVRQEALARSLGAAGYLVKPVRRQDFLRVLEEALASPAAAR